VAEPLAPLPELGTEMTHLPSPESWS
jgi:hypothetical protein